jgi:deoxyribodipyrimidine photo-lyase
MSGNSASADMQRDFASREQLTAYLAEQFPEAAAIDAHISPIPGGRRAAEARLEAVDPEAYAATRNRLTGKVTRLSPYLRYGVLSLAEVKRRGLAKVAKQYQAEKFVNELAWRDYWQRLYAKLGDGIWRDQEPFKTGFTAAHYADSLPDDIARGTTGLVCMDSFTRELRETGYLHNHARMWMAAYIVHFRRVSLA